MIDRIPDRIPKSVLIGAALLAPVFLIYVAYSQPEYFNSQVYLGGLVFLEFLFCAIWMYRQVFFPVVLMAFLFSGTGLPGGWTAARWAVLAIGALVGCAILAKDRRLSFGLFHGIALFAIIAALLSAAVSKYPGFALLKALSVLLLFVYAGTGARLAVAGREQRFFAGLLKPPEGITTLGYGSCPKADLPKQRTNERQAAPVCILTALLTARNHFTDVGDPKGAWFFLPPWECLRRPR